METYQPAGAPRPRARRRVLAVAGLLLGLGLAAACGLLLRASWKRPPRPTAPAGGSASAEEDPRLTFVTPFRNVRPDVDYVGDASCAACHPGQAETYRRHPMARTLALVSRPGGDERYDRAARDPFEALGFEFTVERRAGRILHKAVRRDAQGRVLTTVEEEALLMLGSGTHGHSYLLNHDGYLFHSPISWYGQYRAWDLAPEFKNAYPRVSPISVRCLFCHSNGVRWLEHTRNHYQEPERHSDAIGCERCHGPGELHVAARTRGEDISGEVDDTIVNPRHLAPALREAVCQQCHLRGEKRIVRRGRQPFDYRPGLPLQRFWSVFVRRPERTDGRKLDHVEQMYLSRCFQQSKGRMGCISCHDPHALPAATERVAYFRSRCLACHEANGCSLAPATRRAKQKEDDCTACHMPSVERTGIAHAPVADHRIVRRAEEAGRRPGRPGRVSPQESPVIAFYPDRREPQDPDGARDLGLALAEFGWERTAPILREQFCRWALPDLETAVQTWPEDVDSWEAKGFALSQLGRGSEALAAFCTALALVPERERTLTSAGEQAELLGQDEAASAYWRRAVAVNPWMPDYHYQLARLLARRGDWSGALHACEAALRLNPTSEAARLLLITCCIRSGSQARARLEFEKLLALNRKNPNVLRRWFAEQMP